MKGIGEKPRSEFSDRGIGGDIKRFESHKKVIAMAGLDRAVSQQSGKINQTGKISKRGNRTLNGDLDHGNEGHPI